MPESTWLSDWQPNEHIYWQIPAHNKNARPLILRVPIPGFLFDLRRSSDMSYTTQQPLLCWTVCSYRRPGMSEEAYHKYTSEVHGPLVKGFLAKYNIVSYTQIHNTTEKRALMAKLFDPQFACIADYDCVITATFRDIEDFVRLKADPEYQRIIAPDHENFADTKRSRYELSTSVT